MTDATFRLLTPRAGTGGAASGAIAVIQIETSDANAMDAALARIGLGGVRDSVVTLRDLMGLDAGLVCRWGGTCTQLMPHGGAVVVSAIEAALEAAGISPSAHASAAYPEARDATEACALRAIALARSPLAVDLILEHADRARRGVPVDPALVAMDALIEPPVVACVGRANVGKSTLVNALAAREVSVVSDVAGTTRDHVGVLLELDGLTVRWLDTPGQREGADEIEAAAHELARPVIRGASLIVSCADHASGFVDDAPGRTLRIGTKADLATVDGAEVRTSAASGAGLGELARAVRRRILPDETLDSPGLWAFSPELIDPGRAC
ncbi:MAG: GTPase [Phycisphaerales bacterium]